MKKLKVVVKLDTGKDVKDWMALAKDIDRLAQLVPESAKVKSDRITKRISNRMKQWLKVDGGA